MMKEGDLRECCFNETNWRTLFWSSKKLIDKNVLSISPDKG